MEPNISNQEHEGKHKRKSTQNPQHGGWGDGGRLNSRHISLLLLFSLLFLLLLLLVPIFLTLFDCQIQNQAAQETHFDIVRP